MNLLRAIILAAISVVISANSTSTTTLYHHYDLVKFSYLPWVHPHRHQQASWVCGKGRKYFAHVPNGKAKEILLQLSDEDQKKLQTNTVIWTQGRCSWKDLAGNSLSDMSPHNEYFNMKPSSSPNQCLALDCKEANFCRISNQECTNKLQYVCPENLAMNRDDQRCPDHMEEHEVKFKRNYRSCHSTAYYKWEQVTEINECRNWNESLMGTVDQVNRILYNAKGHYWLDGHYECDKTEEGWIRRDYAVAGDCASIRISFWKGDRKWASQQYINCETISHYALCYSISRYPPAKRAPTSQQASSTKPATIKHNSERTILRIFTEQKTEDVKTTSISPGNPKQFTTASAQTIYGSPWWWSLTTATVGYSFILHNLFMT